MMGPVYRLGRLRACVVELSPDLARGSRVLTISRVGVTLRVGTVLLMAWISRRVSA